MTIGHQRSVGGTRRNVLELSNRLFVVRPEYGGDASDFTGYVSHAISLFEFRARLRLYYPGSPEGRLMKNPLSSITERLTPAKPGKMQQALKVTAGTAAAIWVVLRLKRELYGPGGTKMSRYDKSVDEVWNEK